MYIIYVYLYIAHAYAGVCASDVVGFEIHLSALQSTDRIPKSPLAPLAPLAPAQGQVVVAQSEALVSSWTGCRARTSAILGRGEGNQVEPDAQVSCIMVDDG